MIQPHASIEINRTSDHISMSVCMPFWVKDSQDPRFSTIIIPLFGLKTYAEANNDEDIKTSIEEAVKCFTISAERFGQGIEKELQVLGWKAMDGSLEFMQEDPIIEQIMNTGDTYVDSLELDIRSN